MGMKKIKAHAFQFFIERAESESESRANEVGSFAAPCGRSFFVGGICVWIPILRAYRGGATGA